MEDLVAGIGLHSLVLAATLQIRTLLDRNGGLNRLQDWFMVPVCPKCDVSLMILRFHDIEVDICERCRGLWLDEGELEELVTQTGGRASDAWLRELGMHGTAPQLTDYLCPRCDNRLGQITRGDLAVETCPQQHGIWVDADELTRLLAAFPTDAGVSKTIDYLNTLFVKPIQGETDR